MPTITSDLQVRLNFTATDEFPVSQADGRHKTAYIRNMLRDAGQATVQWANESNPVIRARWNIAKKDTTVAFFDTDATQTPNVLLTIGDPNIILIPEHSLALPGYPYDYDFWALRQHDSAPKRLFYGTLLVIEDVGS